MHSQRAKRFIVVAAWLLLSGTPMARSQVGTIVPISEASATSMAASLFPVTVELEQGRLFLTNPSVRFINADRMGIQVRFQAYDHRPAEGIALSETGRAQLSGRPAYDPATRRILLHDPLMEELTFDRDNQAARRFSSEVRKAWASQVKDPVRTELPPHPYLLPFRNNIKDITYDGSVIALTVAY